MWAAAAAAAVVIGSLGSQAPAGAATVPPMPQGYPIENLYQTCTQDEAHSAGYPAWHYGETARRYLSDGVVEFKNTTNHSVDYTAKVESGTNHVISANSRAELPSGWNTTARSDIGLTTDNGWVQGETFGPITLAPGETFRVEFGVLEKDFISMFVTCEGGFYQNMAGTDVVRGTGPAERYAFANIIRADGTVDQQALQIPPRAQGANSKPIDRPYNAITGPSLEKIADSRRDRIVEPVTTPQRDPNWPAYGAKCDTAYPQWYPHDIHGIAPTFRKPGYSQDFLNWADGEQTYTPVVDHIVGAQMNVEMNYRGNGGRLPAGWLESVGAVHRAYMPVGTALKPVDLQPGERVRVEYGTTMMRVQYSEYSCDRPGGSYTKVLDKHVATAPAGFWAEATITSPDGSTRKQDVTPDDWAELPVPTQTIY
ncbi:hypothetical protein C3E79_05140 [Corynebacterium liangguodongii]|uniref:Uncharacterized protein n=1 Tax=Corynebacterium liangguodongii TaxID=2079535 RepID=A0A2S0WDU7_9CORY|nr:hypothetical protein C3E79_05140 [Corynebacterium liangguodongii]PWB99078.1 hypothetical protein DF219_08790 [Corynebacterium liangguodongii]